MVSIILPFFIAFSTYEFWKKRETYFEQPKVVYRKELLMEVYSESEIIENNSLVRVPSTQFFSTIGELNDLYFQRLSPVLLKSSKLDSNFDDYAEEFNFNLTLFSSGNDVKNIKVVTFYEYQIRKRIKMDMVALAWVDVNTPYGAGNVYVDGVLEFKQLKPLKPSSTTRDDYDFSVLSLESGYENFFPVLALRYNDRNYTTQFNYISQVQPRGQNYSTIHIKVRIPISQKLEYAPNFLETMKFAWIQYQSILIPIGLLFYALALFMFGNQILDATVENELKLKNN
jgi:transmembrane protein 231